MVKEIEQISHTMLTLNFQVHGTILGEENINLLQESLKKMKSIKENINNLLHQSSLIPLSNNKELTGMITKIYELLTELGITVEIIEKISSKFIYNYRDEWNIIKTNQA